MSGPQREIKLVLPNEIECLPSLLACACAHATSLGFSDEDIENIRLGLEEAAGNVIKHAFRPGEKESFEVVLKTIPLGLEITIREMGIPFDPESLPACKPGPPHSDPTQTGLGLRLMHKAMDQVAFKNLGYGGKETTLVKYFSSKRVDEHIAGLERAVNEPEPREKLPPIPFQVRPMLPSEAIEISRCAYTSYGYSYIHENIYFPERVRAMNSEEKMLSFVAVTEDGGELIGHVALELSDDADGLVEIGVAFVRPEYRGMGVLEKLSEVAIADARRRGFAGIFAHAVCTHPFSQRGGHKLGLKASALFLSRLPVLGFKEIERANHQRETLLLASMPLKPFPTRRIFAPPQHLDIIREIYENLELAPIFGNAETGLNSNAGDCAIGVSTDLYGCAKIEVKSYGQDVVKIVRRALKTMCVERIESVYLYLNLCDPLTAELTEKFETMDFFFAGILAGGSCSEKLVLQYLNNAAVDYDALKFASDMGARLAMYIKEHDPNLSV